MSSRKETSQVKVKGCFDLEAMATRLKRSPFLFLQLAPSGLFCYYKKVKNAAKILMIAFTLNFFWEIGQVGLYAPHFEGVAGFVRVHLWASFGDLFLTLFILSLDTTVFKRIFPGKEMNRKRIAAMMCAGFVLAFLIEKFALESGRWSYSGLMPIIPFLDVGLTPVLQMTIIPALALFLGSIKRKD